MISLGDQRRAIAGPPRVAYVLKRYPRLSQTFVLNEMLELERQGVDLTVVALKESHDGAVDERTQALRAPVHYVPSLSADVPEAPAIARLLAKLGVGHIHAHFATSAATAASLASEIAGIPYSFTAHARDIYHESVNRAALATKIEKARFVITVSDSNKRHLDALLAAEGRSGRVIRLYNGVDLEELAPFDGDREPGLVVGVGRLVEKKGFRYLVEACRILRDRGRRFRCAIIGEGDERGDLEQRVARYALDGDVSLPGARSHAEVIRTIKQAEAFVLPCVVGEDGDRDGLPTVLLEAMAVGVPVISTPVAGIPEIIGHERTGLLVEEKDPESLADAIDTLLGSRTLREMLRASAIAKIRAHFDLARNVKTLKKHLLAGVSPC